MTHLSEVVLGFATRPERLSRTVSVGTSSTKVAPANPNRIRLDLINPGSNDVWVLDDPEVAVDEGYLLEANGGSLGFEIPQDGNLAQAEFHAIAESSATTVVRRGEVAAETPMGGSGGA